MTKFNIRRVPFSRFGSYLAISDLGPPHSLPAGISPGIWLRAFSGESARELLKFELLLQSQSVACRMDCDEAVLTLLPAEGDGSMRMVWAGTDRLQICGAGTGQARHHRTAQAHR
jgi:hypothetical protein